jgi:hypothetical protein
MPASSNPPRTEGPQPNAPTELDEATSNLDVEDGRLVEAGPPSALLDRGGRFVDLYDRWVAGAA